MLKPLKHFKIVDLSRILAGPFATQLLADFGAEVLKLEPPGGDPTRGWGPPFEEGDHGESAYFRCANRGKTSEAIDLHSEEGKVRLMDLLKDADVLVENFVPDSADRLGLTWKRLHKAFPKLILASIRGFASDVVDSRRAGYDFIIQAESGWMSITGESDGRPMKVGVALVDVLAALYCANGIQAALLHRERTGEAIRVEVPLMEAALAGLVNVGAGALMTGKAPTRYGNGHPQIVPYQSFRCGDGDVAIGVGSDKQFEILALWLGLDLEANPTWRQNRGRVADREKLVALIEEKLQPHTIEGVAAFCSENAIPASQVRTVDEVLFRKAGESHHLIKPLFEEETGRMIPTLAAPVLLNGERACAKTAAAEMEGLMRPPRFTPAGAAPIKGLSESGRTAQAEARLREAWGFIVGPALASRTCLLRVQGRKLVLGCWHLSLIPSLREAAEQTWPQVSERIAKALNLQLDSIAVLPCDPPQPITPRAKAPEDPFRAVLDRLQQLGKKP